ncbi:MAG: hypothetical protein E7456_00240 [Ruminococcaceae bacterium]|nr:hypothetical protein [Oscillospiraceae bacterium]
MIILAELAPAAKSLLTRSKRILTEKKTILGMNVTVLKVPISDKIRAGQLERIKRRTHNKLAELCANTVFIRNDFPYPEWFEGYRKPDGAGLVRRLSDRLAVNSSDRHYGVYVYLKRPDSECVNILRKLCEQFRFIYLSVKNGEADVIADGLMKTCGVSIVTVSDRIPEADAAVFLHEPDEMPILNEKCVCISAEKSEVSISLSDGREAEIPDGYSRKALIAHALLHGYVRLEDIRNISLKNSLDIG